MRVRSHFPAVLGTLESVETTKDETGWRQKGS